MKFRTFMAGALFFAGAFIMVASLVYLGSVHDTSQFLLFAGVGFGFIGLGYLLDKLNKLQSDVDYHEEKLQALYESRGVVIE